MSEPAKVAVFWGQVHPMGFGWRMEPFVRTKAAGDRWTLEVHGCSFFVTVTPVLLAHDLNSLGGGAMEFARSCLDALGFCIGTVLTPEFVGASIDGRPLFIEPSWNDVFDVGPLRNAPSDRLQPVVLGALQHQGVRLALADISLAVDRPEDTAFYAYRAVECVRQHFIQPEDKNKAESWEHLRTTLGIEKSDLDWLKGKADIRRHGEPTFISKDDRVRAIKLARTVVDAFLVHLNPAPTLPDPEPANRARPSTV